MNELEDEYDYQREIEPDVHTLNENMNRSRYVFAMISFLIALIFLGIFFNSYYDLLSGWFLLTGAFVFGAAGVFFLWPNPRVRYEIRTTEDESDQSSKGEFSFFKEDDNDTFLEEGEETNEAEFTPFEELVRESLATIPTEFHDQMENVLVRVQYEPGDEVMHRVGVKEGYTLLGLYEGVPITAYGQARLPHPEIITIYERSIVEYCHG